MRDCSTLFLVNRNQPFDRLSLVFSVFLSASSASAAVVI